MLRRRAGSAVAALLLSVTPLLAHAQVVCDAASICPDDDGDGFAACGCEWSGTPCDCDDADPTTFPGAPERCDAPKDHDCSGVAAVRCPSRQGCYAGACVPQCVALDDFGCAFGSSFHRDDAGTCLCRPNDCTLFGCPPGMTCDDDRTCVPSCHPGVRCPHGQLCRGSGCVDPCAEVTCPAGAACDRGRCVPSCACPGGGSCAPGLVCDTTAPAPACVEAACSGVRCPPGTHCAGGRCVDDCEGVVCPPKLVCRKASVNGAPAPARCVDLCKPDPCTIGFACAWQTGTCVRLPPAEGGLVAPPGTLEPPLDVAGAGFSCAASPGACASFGGACASLLLALLRARRRSSNPT